MDEMEENEELTYLELADLKIVHWFFHTERLNSEVKIAYIGLKYEIVILISIFELFIEVILKCGFFSL